MKLSSIILDIIKMFLLFIGFIISIATGLIFTAVSYVLLLPGKWLSEVADGLADAMLDILGKAKPKSDE